MKKMIIFFIMIIIVICIVFGIYTNYKANYNIAKKENFEFERYINKEIYGTELTTIINRAVNSNEKNEIQKNEKGLYIDNKNNSIEIDIKITDNNSINKMEKIYSGGMENFVKYYRIS